MGNVFVRKRLSFLPTLCCCRDDSLHQQVSFVARGPENLRGTALFGRQVRTEKTCAARERRWGERTSLGSEEAAKGRGFLEGKRSEDVRIAASCNLLKRRPSGDKVSFPEKKKRRPKEKT